MARRFIFGALVAALSALGAMAVAGQSDVGFPREAYAARRAKLAATIGDGVAIVPGRYSIGDGSLFKHLRSICARLWVPHVRNLRHLRTIHPRRLRITSSAAAAARPG